MRWIELIATDDQSGDVLDYGCGIGADVTYYRSQGLDADGFDPHEPFGYPKPQRQFRIVTLIYVLNVLPTRFDRLDALRAAAAFLVNGGRLVVATRSPSAVRAAASRGGWHACGDGYISNERRSMFQHGMDRDEIRVLGECIGLRRAETLPIISGASVIALTNQHEGLGSE
jgi:Methyltransferase domain